MINPSRSATNQSNLDLLVKANELLRQALAMYGSDTSHLWTDVNTFLESQADANAEPKL